MDDDSQQRQEKEPRISNTSAALMIATAVIFDLISIIPVAGQLLADVGSFVVFLIWFLILGLPLVSPKKLLTVTLAYIIEFIPATSALPAITVGVILMIVFTRAEDKLGIQLLNTKGVPNVGNIAKAGSTVRTIGGEVMKKNEPTLSVARKINSVQQTAPRMDDMLSSPA